MTEQQWDEFLDKLDFAHLCDRWELLPLHWLEEDFPPAAGELEKDLVRGLLELRGQEDGEERLEAVKSLCVEYRTRLGARAVALDSRLCPPGSRVTLRYLNPQDLGEGDCLITTGSWDQLGYLVAELAHPGAEHVDSVGEEPVRLEPGELSFRHIILFPDKGNPSPRAFRAQCEKTLRQARGYGGKHFVITHLHPAQSGLADRFAAAELVSAVRQMLRDGPGTNVDILVFSHRNFEDYRHWFESLKGLGGGATQPPTQGAEVIEEETDSEGEESEVVETLRNLARRSGEVASEATASVTRWFKGQSVPAAVSTGASFAWRDPNFEEREQLARLYLGRAQSDLPVPPNAHRDPTELYLWALNQVVLLERNELSVSDEHTELLEGVREWSTLASGHRWHRYFRLLERRLALTLEQEPQAAVVGLLEEAKAWGDRVLAAYLAAIQEESGTDKAKAERAPVSPGGSRRQLV